MQLFHNRHEAGLALADRLRWTVEADPYTIVVGLARGGVVVGAALADRLRTELDVLLVRPLELPNRPGWPIGAMVSGGLTVLNEEAVQYANVSEEALDRLTTQVGDELNRKESLYRDGRAPIRVTGRTVILADDGFSSSLAIRAAARALRPQSIRRLIVAVPMATRQMAAELAPEIDDLVCLALPLNAGSPAMWYVNHTTVADEEIRKLLEEAAYETKAAAAGTY